MDFAERLVHGDVWDPVSQTWAYGRARRAKVGRGDDAFARLVRRHREQREVTLAELAERTGVSASALSKIERGHSQPTLGVVLALSDALGLGVREYLADL